MPNIIKIDWAKQRVLFIGIVCLCLTTISCEKEKKWDLPPNTSLTFGFVDTSELIRRIPHEYIWPNKEGYLDSLAYCYNNNGLVYDEYAFAVTSIINDEHVYPYYYINLGGVKGERIASMSVGGEEWILDWPSGIRDTLYLEYYEDHEGPNNCNCKHPYKTITLNGELFKEIANPTGNGTFLF